MRNEHGERNSPATGVFDLSFIYESCELSELSNLAYLFDVLAHTTYLQ